MNGYGSIYECYVRMQLLNDNINIPFWNILLSFGFKGNVPSALDRFYEFMYTPPVKVAIYGPAFSSVAAVLAEVIGKWNIVEVSNSYKTRDSLDFC